ncbi:MAG TPA: HEPN domain-containing protein [Chthoniobacteraceae bacterium]|jgi:HEPN domain-containing protein|nr:HEPN domain-containing protein [Chthoniobacteraceae bacterium]
MRPETAEWVEKAEGDYRTASREAEVTTLPNYDAVCFHAQQCIEKYLKALLVEANAPFPRTHDLLALLALASPHSPAITALQSTFGRLAPYSVAIRYPGDQATATDAATAFEDCEEGRTALRLELHL